MTQRTLWSAILERDVTSLPFLERLWTVHRHHHLKPEYHQPLVNSGMGRYCPRSLNLCGNIKNHNNYHIYALLRLQFFFCTSTTIMHRPSLWQTFWGQFTIIVYMNNVESNWCSIPHTYWTMHNNFVQMCQNPTAQSTPLKTLGKSKIGYMELIAYISSNYMRILPVAAERTFLTSWNQWERLAPAKLCSILINVSLTFYNVKRRYYQYIRASLWHFWVR